ncbi:hypothetical protein EV356DRAFT_532838 [Viridothelium virens]|uniref:SnoaL-like domain-containing protein n=1 Tax=Viridothelium virens TaxID=1048519 RepID=A0A6A6HAK8_VIRVR|nr:hypothetical protein EV356DRAFT_532838 [Viridothelium virens]
MSTDRIIQLRSQTNAFSRAFTSNLTPSEILDRFFVADTPRITEHGPSWAASRLPFLGKTFEGRAACEEYFNILGEVLEFSPYKDTFPDANGFVVDPDADPGEGIKGRKGVVHVKAKAKFLAKTTGIAWEEEFAYRLSAFDEEGRFEHWEIWADPLSAWNAVGGGDAHR